MPKIESQPSRRVAFAGTDAQGSAKVWVPKPPTPRRSVFSEVRQALSRAVTHAPLDAALLADEVTRLEASIKDLHESNETLRQQLHIPPPTKKNPRASEFFDLRLKIDGLKTAYKQLQASNFVLGEVASADTQLTRVLDALKGGRPHEIATEATVFFRQLEDLDAHRRGDKPEHTTAALFGQRVQVRMKGASVVQAAALQRSARAFLNQVDPPSKAERAVVESILLGVLARPLPSETSKKALQTLDSRRLSAISVSTKAILEELGHLGLKLKPKDKVPGTGLPLEALQALLKNADALQKKRAIAPTRQKLGALTAQTNPIRKAVTPSTSRPSVQVQTTTTRDKATADAAQQAFQRTLVEAMNFMWNEDVSEEGFAVLLDQSASGLFTKAMVQLQEAGLDDDTQRQWILDALGSVKPSLLPHLRPRLDDGFQQRLAQEIDASRFEPKQELKDLAGLWWYCVMSATDANT